MSRIVLAWELGHGYGHVMPLFALARPLIDAGHELTLITRDLVRARRVFSSLPVRLLAAPLMPGIAARAQQQNSLADVIWFDAGGHDAEVFSGLFSAWRSLLQVLRADLLIADAAPLALAAAQGLMPRLSYDNGFHCTDPQGWAIFRDWERINAGASLERAQRLQDHLNHARTAASLGAVDSLSAGFQADRLLIRFPAALDYAGPRPGARYLGQPVPSGATPEWPDMPLPQRLFVYLRESHPLTDRMLSALARLPQTQVLCFHDGLPPARQRQAAHLRYIQTPLDLGCVLPTVDAVVCHGGGLQALALQYGKPTLALPLHTEQFLSARKAEQAGCGLLYLARGERPDFLPLLRQLLGQASLREHAQTIAAAHQACEPDPLGAAVAEVHALLTH